MMLTIIAIHGNGGGAFRFKAMLPFVPPDIRFKPITLPGFAEIPPDPRIKTMRDYADYLRTVITEESRPLVALGTGIGGALLLEYIQHDADTLDGIILHSPVGTRLNQRWFAQVMNPPLLRKCGQRMITSPLLRPLLKRLFFVDSKRIPAQSLNRFFEAYQQAAAFSQMFDIITPAWYNELKPVNIPSALLWGGRERVFNVRHVEDYQKLLPNSTVRIVPGWKHFPMVEEPESYTREVIELVRGLL
jgi:pimeloyl-ACP methyl ester carboxylesterase